MKRGLPRQFTHALGRAAGLEVHTLSRMRWVILERHLELLDERQADVL